MLEAEKQMKQFLNGKTLQWMHEELENILLEEQLRRTTSGNACLFFKEIVAENA